eukprot:1015416-Prymnesium_polylepis.3
MFDECKNAPYSFGRDAGTVCMPQQGPQLRTAQDPGRSSLAGCSHAAVGPTPVCWRCHVWHHSKHLL